MTIIGKILVILCLVFSLVVGFMGIQAYITRVNWKDALDKSEAYRAMDKGNLMVAQSQLADARKEGQDKIAELNAALKRVQDDLVAQQNVNKDQAGKLTEEEKKTAKAEALAVRADAEVARRQADVEKLRATLTDEQKKNIQLVKDTLQMRERTTAAEIQSNTLKNLNARLENQLQEMARDIARVRSSQGATTVAARTGANPPTEKIEGLVKTADPSGLVKITLGSDAGLQRGHTMEVFRINTTNPNLSRYIGTIRIIEVSATEAVGQPTGKLQAGGIQAGDTVASRILGG